VAFIPYSCQNITDDDVAAVVRALRSEYLTQGPTITAFEKAFARAHAVPHGIAVANATAALHIACVALGVSPGKRVWTSPNSFVASANCALYCGAEVDFVDIDPATRNMSVAGLRAKLEAARATNALPHVVVPVDFSGFPCDLREMRELANQYGFRILQDASHAAGAQYLGRPVGSQFADITVFSFHAVKIITTAEGGLLTTHDAALAERLRLLRSHGITRNSAEMAGPSAGAWYYEQVDLGFNYRITDLQAALGLSQLARIRTMLEQRERLVERYDRLLRELPLILPPRAANRRSSWHLYAVEIDETRTNRSRAEVFAAMRNAAIGVNVHYIPIHVQPHYRRLGFAAGMFPASECYYSRALSIPLFPALTDEQQLRVVETLRVALRPS
jgi:UDP-4-amino-4,6-dideoxy-N-acetyl-beta-L-altrosamine transaminase